LGSHFKPVEDVIDTIEKQSLYTQTDLPFIAMRTCRGLKGNGQRGFKDEDIPQDHEKAIVPNRKKLLLKTDIMK
jgi:oxygen-independent coproporphyrinogen-3 oxidase